MNDPSRHRRPHGPSPWSGVELLDRSIAYTRGCLELVRPHLMGAATPCRDWDLRRLLQHMDDSLASLHEAGATRRVRVDVESRPTGDLVESLRRRACDVLADFSRTAEPVPGTRGHVLVDDRPVTAPVLTSTGALEIAVHGWDVSVACRAPRPLPDELAAALLLVAPVLVTDSDRPVRFAAPLEPPPGARPGERLLAFLGREPRPANGAGPATAGGPSIT